ncbi:hypothetical protein PENTCL1PPCAC_20472, partial [Pristionchus entomophagus]
TTIASLAETIHFLASQNLSTPQASNTIELNDFKEASDLNPLDLVDLTLKFANSPLGEFLKKLASYEDTDSLIAAITCGQTKDQNNLNAPSNPNGNQQPVHTVSDTLREYIIEYVSQFSSGIVDSSDDADCVSIPRREMTCSFDSNALLQQV